MSTSCTRRRVKIQEISVGGGGYSCSVEGVFIETRTLFGLVAVSLLLYGQPLICDITVPATDLSEPTRSRHFIWSSPDIMPRVLNQHTGKLLSALSRFLCNISHSEPCVLIVIAGLRGGDEKMLK